MSKKEEVVETKVNEFVDEMITSAENIEVKLSLGPAEFVGIHTVFIAGQVIGFFDGLATVTPDQADKLRENGYIE